MVGISVMIWALLFSTFRGNDPYATEPDPYHYEGEEGQEKWGTEADSVYKLCSSGTKQSPIEIKQVSEEFDTEKLLKFDNYGTKPAMTLENNKNTLIINIKGGESKGESKGESEDVGPTIAAITSTTEATGAGKHIDSPASTTPSVHFNEIDYKIDQIIFHWGDKEGEKSTGTEHSINGKKNEMEIQVLHKGPDNKLLVVAFQLSIASSGKDYPGLPIIEPMLAEVKDGSKPVEINDVELDKLVPIDEIRKDFYSYEGSLTAPPCTEEVVWCIADQLFVITQEQLDKFNELDCVEDDKTANKGHIRKLQEKNILAVTRLRESKPQTSKGRSVRMSRQIRPSFYITSMVILFVAI